MGSDYVVFWCKNGEVIELICYLSNIGYMLPRGSVSSRLQVEPYSISCQNEASNGSGRDPSGLNLMGIPLGIARTAPDWVYRPGPAPINPHGMPGWVPAGSRGQKPAGPRRVSHAGPVCRLVQDPQGTRVTVLAGKSGNTNVIDHITYIRPLVSLFWHGFPFLPFPFILFSSCHPDGPTDRPISLVARSNDVFPLKQESFGVLTDNN